MDQKTIIRKAHNRDNPYTMVHKGLLQDAAISAKCKGLLVYILSLPDDWQIYETELVNHFTDKRDSIRAGLREARQSGYMVRTRIRDERGHFRGYEYLVFETRQVPENIADLSIVGKSNIGESNTTNINSTKHGFQAGKKARSLTHYEADPMWRRAVDAVV